MANGSAYRDPLESVVARVGQLERERSELLTLTAGVRRARFRRRAGAFAAFVTLIVIAPALAWVVRGRMPPPPPAVRSYEGRYELHSWTTLTSATPSGPMKVDVDPATGKAQGWATGPIGSVRIHGQVRGDRFDVIAVNPDGHSSGTGSGHVIGDTMNGSFGVPRGAASASFFVRAASER